MNMNLIAVIHILYSVTTIIADFDLTILHTNDVHAHYEQFDINGGVCKVPTECYGGVSRRHTVISEIRKNVSNVLLMDGGDQFTGTIWTTYYNGQAAAMFMNYSSYDVMAIGNHEFDNGPANLVSFIKSTNFTVLAGNVDGSNEPSWPADDKYNTKSIVLDRSGVKIGVIGYTTIETSWLSQPGDKMKFHDVITSVQKEATKLKGNGVQILIALGHAGIRMDKQIAKEVTDIDVVVGGHTNTFLYTGEAPSNNVAEDIYPITMMANDGSKTLVVQDFEYGKYLGRLNIKFNDGGELISWNGNPVLLDNKIEEDAGMVALVTEMLKPIEAQKNASIGRSMVALEGFRSVCRYGECNLGNLITDGILKMNQRYPDESEWAFVSIALYNSGGIRSSIVKNITETITMEDLTNVLPFGNTADIIEITGDILKEAFEHSVSRYEEEKGQFLQQSGARVVYDITKPVGQRVIELKVLCTKCRVPKYELVEDSKTYKIMTAGYLANGGDGYEMFKRNLKHHTGDVVRTLIVDYIKRESPLTKGVDERIRFVTSKDPCASSSITLKSPIYIHFIALVLSCWYRLSY